MLVLGTLGRDPGPLSSVATRDGPWGHGQAGPAAPPHPQHRQAPRGNKAISDTPRETAPAGARSRGHHAQTDTQTDTNHPRPRVPLPGLGSPAPAGAAAGQGWLPRREAAQPGIARAALAPLRQLRCGPHRGMAGGESPGPGRGRGGGGSCEQPRRRGRRGRKRRERSEEEAWGGQPPGPGRGGRPSRLNATPGASASL